MLKQALLFLLQCLPVTIDAGTNNKALLEDKAYLGLRMPRDRSPVYDALIEEFFHAVHDIYGRNTLVQVSFPYFILFL